MRNSPLVARSRRYDIGYMAVMNRTTPYLQAARTTVAGLSVVTVATAIAMGLNLAVPELSPLMTALVLGVLVANVGIDLTVLRPGLSVASRRVLRIGIVLLGLQVSLSDILGLGAAALTSVVLIVCLGFAFTVAAGHVLGIPANRSLLIASGFSICGASAAVAMDGIVRSDEDDVTAAIAGVTLFGSLCILILPLLDRVIPLTAEQFGLWAGLSVHEVAQVVATTTIAAPSALAAAVTIKLGRVIMLAPVIAMTSIWIRRKSAIGRSHDTERFPALVPMFVLGFLAMVGVASVDVLPTPTLGVAKVVQLVLMTAALFALGTVVRVETLVRSSGRFLLLGAISTAFMVGTGLLAAVLVR